MRRGLIAISLFAVLTGGFVVSARTGAAGQQSTIEPADLVITNGKVVTVEDGAPNAQAVAIRGSRIAAVRGIEVVCAVVGDACNDE